MSICYHTQQVFILSAFACLFRRSLRFLMCLSFCCNLCWTFSPSLFWLFCHVWWLRHSCFKYSCSVWRTIWHASQQCFSLQRLLCIVSFMLKVRNLSQAFHVKSKTVLRCSCSDFYVSDDLIWALAYLTIILCFEKGIFFNILSVCNLCSWKWMNLYSLNWDDEQEY